MTTAQDSNLDAFMTAIHDTAWNVSGINWAGSRIGSEPTGPNVMFPFLLLDPPARVGYARNGEVRRGGTFSRLNEEWEPVSEVRIRGWFYYNPQAQDDNRGMDVARKRNAIEKAFIENETLDESVQNTLLVSATTGPYTVGGREVTEVIVTIQVLEVLDVDYD